MEAIAAESSTRPLSGPADPFPASPRIPVLYLAATFLSAFLLFLVQPMVARRILPWFGGAASVWTTCMLFFQSVLLAGYYYAHRMSRLPGGGPWHVAALAIGVLVLPTLVLFSPSPHLDPVLSLLLVVTLWVGIPYLLLSATGPLVQAWFAREHPGVAPYRLYAVSNLGSVLGLVAYPLAIEPLLGLDGQIMLFAGGFIVYAVLAGKLAWRSVTEQAMASISALAAAATEGAERPSAKVRAGWLIYPGFSSALLLAVTTHLTQNIAPVPFLWVLPLVLYLASFIVCFDRPEWYRRELFHPLTMAALASMSWAMVKLDPASTISLSIPLFSAGLFVVCMFCHGELAALKPRPQYLTSFYLHISAGGAIGALAVAVGAPVLLRHYFELAIVLAACSMLALFANYRKHWLTDLLWTAVAIGAVTSAMVQIQVFRMGNLSAQRNFYGALRIADLGETRVMIHGTVNHGVQWRDEARRREPTSYYGRTSGVGQLLTARRPERVGIIGLGAGALATYAQPGDRYRFYELNPQVAQQAQASFTFLADSRGEVSVGIGDGRLLIDREPANGYDVLVVDAFSGDSIPMHLLTREAGEVYRRHLKAGGVLALHISNSSLNLAPEAAALAQSLGAKARLVEDPGDGGQLYASQWVLIALDGSEVPGVGLKPDPARLWTDDHSNLLAALKW